MSTTAPARVPVIGTVGAAPAAPVTPTATAVPPVAARPTVPPAPARVPVIGTVGAAPAAPVTPTIAAATPSPVRVPAPSSVRVPAVGAVPAAPAAPPASTAPRQPYVSPASKLPDPPEVPGKWRAQYSRDGQSYVVPGVDGVRGTDTIARATRHAKVLGDSTALTDWRLRATVLGLARNPQLLDELRLDGAEHLADLDFPAKRALGRVAARAARRVGADDGNAFGTKLHGYLEAVLEGVIAVDQVPDMLRPHILVVFEAMRRHNLAFVAQMVERTVFIPTTGMVGTFDFLVVDEHGTLIVGDLKTSSHIDYSWLSIGVQLGQYAGATLILSRDGSRWEPMPEISQVVGKVISAPMDAPVPSARIYTVNLALGMELVETASRVKAITEAAFRAASAPERYGADDELLAWADGDPVSLTSASAAG